MCKIMKRKTEPFMMYKTPVKNEIMYETYQLVFLLQYLLKRVGINLAHFSLARALAFKVLTIFSQAFMNSDLRAYMYGCAP